MLFLACSGVVLVLSHEGLAPFLLYLACAVMIAIRSMRRALILVLIPALAVAVTLVVVVHHRGSARAEQTICQSIEPAPAAVCSGSIRYLANDAVAARQDVEHDLHAYHYLLYYPLLSALGLIPLVGMFRRLWAAERLRRDLILIACTGLVTLLASIPLFVYAMDWGRWIYIHMVSLFLLLLFLDVRQRALSPEMAPRNGPAFFANHPRWATVALVLYATCWNVPHYGNYPKKGYLNLPLHLLKQKLDGHHRTAEVQASRQMRWIEHAGNTLEPGTSI